MNLVETNERKLVYFSHYNRLIKNINGAPIYEFHFKDVETNKNIILKSFINNSKEHKYYKYVECRSFKK